MSDRIRVRTEWLDQCARDFGQVAGALADARSTLSGITLRRDEGGELKVSMDCSLKLVGQKFTGSNAEEDVKQLARAAQALSERVRQLGLASSNAARHFEEVENAAIALLTGAEPGKETSIYSDIGAIITAMKSIIDWLRDLFQGNTTPPETPPAPPVVPVFGEEPFFGGNQMTIRTDYANHEKYKQIIEQNTGHTFAEGEFEIYLRRMQSEGCGYIAIVNSIFAAYEGNPEGFKKTFGFDMYDGDKLNYNMLFADVYSKWDNRNANGEFDAYKDYSSTRDGDINNYDYWKDPSGSGTNISWRDDIAEQYLREYGVQATAESHPSTTLTADMYNNMVSSGEVKQGELHIRMYGDPANLYDADGNLVTTYSGGHAMTVTGTIGSGENAMLEVSSWGKKYYVKPSEVPAGDMGYMILHIDGSSSEQPGIDYPEVILR